MFTFDPTLGNTELLQLSKQWGHLDDSTKANIADVFNRNGSDEFYRGVVAALHACAKLMTDASYPESAKPTAVIGAMAYVASKISMGKWPQM